MFDEETIRIWKAALDKVGALKGWHVKSNDEQGAVADLVTGVVWAHLSKNTNDLDTDKLIGMDDHIEEIKERLALDSPCMTIVGIHGIGGIGKTTIAKAVYNNVSPQFDRCSFVEDVREMLQQRDGVVILQKHVISDILRVKNFAESIANSSEGIRMIKDRISRFKFLIVLDDVDEKFEFDKILGNIKNFASRSRFVIASRNVKVLRTLTDDCKLYRVREMNHHHSLQLFCNHAFKKDSPPSSYETLSKDIVSIAAGLPLTLKVVGSLLFQEEEVIWEDKLRQLKEIPEEKVLERLKISYDTLNEDAKQIFLDIACFFIGEEKGMPCYMWSDCGFFPIVNTNILVQRSMIELVKDNRLQMHDQLRDMGREIVRQENTKHPWQRSRIWSREQALDTLHNKKGTNQVEAIRIDSLDDVFGVNEFGDDCFMNLTELRYLDAKSAKLTGDLSNRLPYLRWLRLDYQPLYLGGMRSFANICLENLVILQLLLPTPDNWEDWSHIKKANKLKVLELSPAYAPMLQFPQSQSLEILKVSDFGGPPSVCDLDIENLRNLKVLHLKDCYVRQMRGGTIGMMKGLQELDINSGLIKYNIRETLVDIGESQNLKILRLKGIVKGNESPYEWVLMGIRLPTSLKVLLTPSPVANLSELLELEELTVEHCGYGLEIPSADGLWWKISKLKSLELVGTKMTIPVATGPSSLPLLPSSLTTLFIFLCPELQWLPNLENLENLNYLFISRCPLLKGIPGLRGMKSLETLTISLKFVCNLDGLDHLHSLKTLSLIQCDELERLPSLASLSKLLELSISSCPRISEIQGLGGLKSLEKLAISRAKSLACLHGFGALLSFNRLRHLSISDCRHLPSLSFDNLDDGQSATILDSLRDLDSAHQV